jgi:photosystem II stability/assembly factor-like uncharacterized protein
MDTETMPLRCPSFLAALAMVIVAAAGTAPMLVAPVQAQAEGPVPRAGLAARGGLPAPGDGFDWERVGDVPIDTEDLAFGRDSTLWATGDDGPYRLDLSGGLPGTWVLLHESGTFNGPLLVLGGDGPDGPEPDTLVSGGGPVKRSTDGGLTWTTVYLASLDALYEVPPGYPYAGRILTGEYDAIAYSDDRAASFTDAVVPGAPGTYGGADDFVALPPGSSHPGRILAAGRWGVNVSDDGGATFRESALWQVLYYVGEAVGVVEQPGPAQRAPGVGHVNVVEGAGGVTPLMAGRVNAQADARAWTSTDGGETWGPGDGMHLAEGPPNAGTAKALLALGGSSALVILRGGTVYRTDDAGATWAPVGRAPEISTAITATSAALHPDGRLYVGLHAAGTEDGWVYRTAAPVTVAVTTEAEPMNLPVVIGSDGGSFRFRVRLRNQTTLPQTVEAWSEASGPLAVSPVLGPRAVMLPPGATVTRTLTQRVPGSAPPGTYTYTVAVGDFPGTVVSADSFTVVKQGATGVVSGAGTEGWTVSGWEAASELEREDVVLEVSPNPFRSETVVTLTRPEPGEVEVALYDVLGRRVGLLHDGALGAGEHTFPLHGGGLPAGVYVVRVEAGEAVFVRSVTRLP